MLRNIVGPHIQSLTDDSKRLLTQGRSGSLKVLHPAFDVPLLQQWHNNNPTSPLCLRVVDDGATLDNVLTKQHEACQRFAPILNVMPAGAGGAVWLEIVINEKYISGDELKRLADVTVKASEICVAAGYRPVGFNIPVGNIAKINTAVVDGVTYNKQTSEMNYIRAAVVELNSMRGAVGYHNYTLSWKQLDSWLDLRYERMALELPTDTQWWLGEALYDYGIVDGNLQGWRYNKFNTDANGAAAYLRKLAQHLAADTRVIGCTPFGAGPTQDWIDRNFQYDNEPAICQVFTESYPVVDTPTIGDGLKKLIPFLGQPLESEVYHFAATPMETSLAVFTNGSGTWRRATNETVGQRDDGAIYTDHGNAGDGIMRQVYP